MYSYLLTLNMEMKIALGLLGTLVVASLLTLLLIFCNKRKCGKVRLMSLKPNRRRYKCAVNYDIFSFFIVICLFFFALREPIELALWKANKAFHTVEIEKKKRILNALKVFSYSYIVSAHIVCPCASRWLVPTRTS